MIIQSVNEYEFTNALITDEFAGWNYEEAKALFNYYDNLSDELNEDIDFDRVAIRCDWTSYKNYTEALEDYSLESIYELTEKTTVIDLKDSILVMNF